VLPSASPVAGAGVTALLAQMRVKQTFVGEPEVHDDEATAKAEEHVTAGSLAAEGVHSCTSQSWQWSGVFFERLPLIDNSTRRTDAAHACALFIRAGASQVRIPGHSESIPSAAFQETQAKWLVVSGRRRMQRAAGRLALGRIEEQGAQVLSTAEVGAIAFQIDSERGLVGPQAQRAGTPNDYRAHPHGDPRDGQSIGPSGALRTLWNASP
jgi:beta-lactamase superfamily II metal-dependent hydrolase